MRTGLLAPRGSNMTMREEPDSMGEDKYFSPLPDDVASDGQIANWIESQAYKAGKDGVPWEDLEAELESGMNEDRSNDYVFGGDYSSVKAAWQEGADEAAR